jgi:hypothetical protein
MNHAFHPEAFEEYVAAASAYEAGQPGLGARFIQSVESFGEAQPDCSRVAALSKLHIDANSWENFGDDLLGRTGKGELVWSSLRPV